MLIRRLTDFINLYNVECDSRRPKGIDRIRAAVLENERQLARMQKAKADDTVGYDTKSRVQATELLERAKRARHANSQTINAEAPITKDGES